jgi:hypothetical protein
MGGGGQSNNTFYILGWCEMKHPNCRYRIKVKTNFFLKNFGSIYILTKIFLINPFHSALGHICKFVPSCKKLYGLASNVFI